MTLRCDGDAAETEADNRPMPLRVAKLGDDVRRNARRCSKAGPLGLEPRMPDPESGTTCEKPRENATFQNSAAPGAAVGTEKPAIDADLQAVIEHWPSLPDAVKAGIVAMVRAARE